MTPPLNPPPEFESPFLFCAAPFCKLEGSSVLLPLSFWLQHRTALARVQLAAGRTPSPVSRTRAKDPAFQPTTPNARGRLWGWPGRQKRKTRVPQVSFPWLPFPPPQLELLKKTWASKPMEENHLCWTERCPCLFNQTQMLQVPCQRRRMQSTGRSGGGGGVERGE